MNSTITAGNASVIDSGTVFTFGDSPIDIKLHDVAVKGDSFILRFLFSHDESNLTPRYEEVPCDDTKCYQLRLINYNNPLGTGVLEPLEFASNKKGPRLFVVFMLSVWEKNLSRRLSYSIFTTQSAEAK